MKRYEVYYQNTEAWEKAGKRAPFWEREITAVELKYSHELVAVVVAEGPEEVFAIMNSAKFPEIPHPLANENAQKWIGDSGVYHTSMSVNDVLREVGSEDYYRVAGFGFEKMEEAKIEWLQKVEK